MYNKTGHSRTVRVAGVQNARHACWHGEVTGELRERESAVVWDFQGTHHEVCMQVTVSFDVSPIIYRFKIMGSTVGSKTNCVRERKQGGAVGGGGECI